jgi:amidase
VALGTSGFFDRAGIHARTLADAARVLDAVKDPSIGYYDPRDPFTALPKALISDQPYASFAVNDAVLASRPKPLQGMRIAILREHMVKGTPNHEAISDQVNREIKTVLRDRLGAELLETITPAYPDDPDVPNVKYTFSDALAELLPRLMPEIFRRRDDKGQLLFAVPGYDVTSYDYLLKLSNRKAPLSNRIRLETLQTLVPSPQDRALEFRMEMDRYLAARGDRKIKTWPDWFANAKFRDDAVRAGAENWVHVTNTVTPTKSLRLSASQIGRMALLKVMRENGIDAFVHAENTVPTPKIGGANVGTASLDGFTPFLQIPRIVVPAGFNRIVYEPTFALNADQTDYVSVLASGTKQTLLPKPMPIAITFFAGQGDEPVLLKIGSAYESATKHRRPPPDFGPVNAREER